MKNMILILVTFTAFAFSYFIIKKLNNLINENYHRISDADTEASHTLRVAAESISHLSSMETLFSSYTAHHPHITFRFGTGTPKCLLQKLARGRLHIVIISKCDPKNLPSRFAYFQIPGPPPLRPTNAVEIPDEQTTNEKGILVIWDKTLQSKERDHFLFVLENEQCHSACGYCDYLD